MPDDSQTRATDQPGYRGDPIACRLPTERDAPLDPLFSANTNGYVFSGQAWRRLHRTADFPYVHYTEVLSGEEWSPLPCADRRPDPISLSARDRVAALGITPRQVDAIRLKLEELVKTFPPDFIVQEILNNDMCGLVLFNWEVALKRLQEGKL